MWGFLCIFFSFFGCVSSGLLARYVGSTGSFMLATGSLFFSFFCACFSLIDSLNGWSGYFTFYFWVVEAAGFNIYCPIAFLFDPLSAVMLVMVTSISLLVHCYSLSYMESDPHLSRFMCYLSMFTFFMLFLVSSSNILQLFVGWEGIGISSYLLIGFWFTRFYATQAAFKAILVNRVGDLGIVLSVCLIFFYFGTLDFSLLQMLVPSTSELSFFLGGWCISLPTLLSFFFILGAMAKSSQVGLHIWLPDAMEGPTPVSALIHAATLVTAGIFLIIRFSFLIEQSAVALSFISVCGTLTALLGATIGLYQYDLKKIVAYSTCSQLGYMFFVCGLSSYDLAIFHLVNHAYFKALLFLGAGSIIHALRDEQDLRRMGGLLRFLPFTYLAMLLGTLGLIGFPFLSGFYSKDLIIEASYFSYFSMVYWIGCLASALSGFYSIRVLYYVFYSPPLAFRTTYAYAHDVAFSMALPLFFLSFATVFVGYLFSEAAAGLGSDFWGSSMYMSPPHSYRADSEFSVFYSKVLPLFASFFGIFFSLLLHSHYGKYLLYSVKALRPFFLFFNRKWFFDQVYNFYVARSALIFSYRSVLSFFDRGLLEQFSVSPVRSFSNFSSYIVSSFNSGYLYHYFFSFMLGVLLTAVGFFSLFTSFSIVIGSFFFSGIFVFFLCPVFATTVFLVPSYHRVTEEEYPRSKNF